MNGIDFGQELKRIRTTTGISSKVLSSKVGKAVTYVSQLENGKIKNPDYNTCYALLNELGVDESKIEGILDFFGFISPEKEKANLEMNIKLMEQEEEKWASGWYSKRYDEIHKKQSIFENTLSSFIQFDLSRAERVIGNLAMLTEEEEDFEFFCSLFENNIASLDSKSKREVLRWVAEYVRNKQNDAFFADDEIDTEDMER
ncbi:Helix-turn-helix [Paenibacillus sophorae]|uniref:Helix-turn-helix n=1 Tax=Paenibacillus sophorae TaxID=1333845 RepID=A0A1H8TGY7_9BACL|nr:helix-turn-helix transcriptional regulator [Paenibacillus sophorae]QWU16209.1 helix-turn-helix domain-containing protein [Paenibacillus sophorae]SEO90360.1 Helix-turn-helix [Paenibacillus sophorae]